jgi:two-component system cell cycle sensor histidine kinase/response regulator CckA
MGSDTSRQEQLTRQLGEIEQTITTLRADLSAVGAENLTRLLSQLRNARATLAGAANSDATPHDISSAQSDAPPASGAAMQQTPLSALPTPVIVLGPDGAIREFNSAAETYFALPRTRALGADYAAMLALYDEHQPLVDALRLALYGETPPACSTVRAGAAGTVCHLSWTVAVQRDTAGHANGAFAFAQDITTDHEQAERLRSDEQDWRSIFHAIGQPAVVLDADHGIIAANDTVVERAGMSRAELLGRKCWEVFHLPGTCGPPRCCPFEQMKSSTTLETVEMEQEAFGGVYLVSCTPVVDAHGHLRKAIHIATDITDRRRAEEKNQRLESQLRQSQKMEAIGQLAGGVAHDFNNILTAILGNTEIARVELQSEQPRLELTTESLREVEANANRAAGLTRQLLAFSRRQATQPQPLDLNETLVNLEPMLRRLLTENIMLVVSRIGSQRLVRADPGQMEQVVLNLAINARDAMPSGGRLILDVSDVDLDATFAQTCPGLEPGPHVMLSVSDTGTGMDAETLEHVFEPFFTTKGLGAGTGLGLATVYGIVRQAAGHINVYSEVGHGTTFRLYLPAQAGTPTRLKNAKATHPPTGAETIFVCEDDEAVRELTGHMLRSAGYTVLTARNGAHAQEIAARHADNVHLLVTDVVMPDTDGRELSRQLAQRWPDLKALFVSGYTADVIAHHGVLDEGVQFLEKPFNQAALLRRVREVLDGTAQPE